MALIFAVSSMQQESLTPERELGLKYGVPSRLKHMAEFFVLSFLAFALLRKNGYDLRYATAIALLLSIGYGVFDEIHQYFTPTRVCAYEDMFDNSVGASLILAIAFLAFLKGRHAKDVAEQDD